MFLSDTGLWAHLGPLTSASQCHFCKIGLMASLVFCKAQLTNVCKLHRSKFTSLLLWSIPLSGVSLHFQRLIQSLTFSASPLPGNIMTSKPADRFLKCLGPIMRWENSVSNLQPCSLLGKTRRGTGGTGLGIGKSPEVLLSPKVLSYPLFFSILILFFSSTNIVYPHR